MRHSLQATRETLHGVFHKSLAPILWVDSGDSVELQTLEAGWRTERVQAGKKLAVVEPRDAVWDEGPALTGPVGVRGALPGQTLEIQIQEVRPALWGWTSAGGPGTTMPGVGVEGAKASVFWEIDIEAGLARNFLRWLGNLEHRDDSSPDSGAESGAVHAPRATQRRADGGLPAADLSRWDAPRRVAEKLEYKAP